MADPSRARLFAAVVIVTLLAGSSLVLSSPRARAGAAIVFSDGFESGSLNPAYNATDSNPLSGLDYWGVSNYRSHSGNYSAWCAEVGNQSSGPFVGQNNSAVHEYDDNMQANLTIDLRVNGYASLTLSFWYWVKTENGGGDWIQAWYVAGGVVTNFFNPRGSSGGSWTPVNLSVPTNITQLVISFHSDSANHGFEGAYVDDIVITGIENVPPTSNVLPLPAYSNAVPFDVTFTAQDNANASGVAYVELFYRFGGAGNYTEYKPAENKVGHFVVSPIAFDSTQALGDGFYEFYTIAVDNAGNIEAPPATADASVTIDTTAPVVSVTSPGSGQTESNATTTFTWTATDSLSGIDHYTVWLDNGAAVNVTGTSVNLPTPGAGNHIFYVTAVDKAGNSATANVAFAVPSGTIPSSFPWLLPLLLAFILLGALLLIFLLWRRRKEEQEEIDAAGEEPEAGSSSEPAHEPDPAVADEPK